MQGGQPTVRNLLALDSIKAWAKPLGLTEASFTAVWGEEMVDGYPRSKGRITFSGDRVEVAGGLEAPGPDILKLMLAEIADAKFPKQQTLVAIAYPPPGVDLSDPKIFQCHDFDGRISMIQQRYDNRDGTKGFLNWTYWSDGEWRKVEPDVMPFFGVPGYEEKSTLFIHEGAKAARRVQQIIAGEADAARFPWAQNMRWGHHIGWLGGVYAVARSDWTKLASLGWKRVIIIADNDNGGVRSASLITRHFRCPTYIVRFDAAFKEGFDCGDPWPESEFDAQGRHTGRAFLDCCQPADYATDLVQVTTDSGRLRTVPVLRPNYVARYKVAVDTQQVFCIDRAALAMGKDRFNDEMRQRSDATNTYGELIKHSEAVCARRVYVPSAPPGPKNDDGEVCWNAFEPSRIQPITGDCGPFLDFMAHLIPVEEDRRAVLRWLATLIARRDVKMHYSLLLISKRQGVGKSTLGRILKLALGSSNVSFPGENSITNSAFNGWALGKLLVFVNEIYSNGNSKVYDRLKTYVTDDVIPINEKHVKEFFIDNWAVFVACSNSEKALFLPDEDRRWLVATVTNQIQTQLWWESFNAWLAADGIAIIKGWANDFAASDWVRPGELPPPTAAKRGIISASKSEGRLLARDFGEEFAGMERAVIRLSDLRAWVAHRRGIDLGHAHLEKERLLIDELENVDGLRVWKGDQRPKIGGRRGSKAAVALNFDPGPAKWGEVEHLLRTMDQIGFGDEWPL